MESRQFEKFTICEYHFQVLTEEKPEIADISSCIRKNKYQHSGFNAAEEVQLWLELGKQF